MVDALGTADDTERQKQVDTLNTETTGSSDVERKRSSRVWFTSLLAEETKGLPTFDAPVMLEVSLNPAESEDVYKRQGYSRRFGGGNCGRYGDY